MKLSSVFDGWVHWFEPGVDFKVSEPHLVLIGVEVIDEDEELAPFETPAMRCVVKDSGWKVTVDEEQRKIETSWGGVSVAMMCICKILGIEREQYQHNEYNKGGSTLIASTFSFRTKEAIGDRI